MSHLCLQDNGEEPVPRLIYHLGQDIKNLAEKILKPFDLTIEQFQPMKLLALSPDLSQRQLGEHCNKTPANLTRILDRLESKGLVKRQPSPHDRRSFLLALTSEGEALVQQSIEILEEFTSELLEGINDQQQAALRQALKQITNNINKLALDYENR